MKTIHIKYPIKTINYNLLKLLFLCFAWITASCKEDNENCGYEITCEEYCELFEDFESKKVGGSGGWLGSALGLGGVLYESRNNSITLHANDGSGGSYIYNNNFMPSNNLLELGCELTFDIEYVAGESNGASATSTLKIYDGTDPISSTLLATFVLNNSNAILDNSGPKTISVPLELGVGTTLPSNSFGSWVLGGITTTTAADIINFNNLIQNIGGVCFWLDVVNSSGTSAPTEQWWFDNFCFKQCCP